MKRFLVSVLFLLSLPLLSAGQATGVKGMVIRSDDSFLIPLQERDSVLIGDQLRYGLHLKDVPQGTVLYPADYSRGFMPGDSVMIVSPWMADTVKVHGSRKGPKSHDIDMSFVITSFEEGHYDLPPLAILRQTAPDRIDTLLFKGQELDVFTIPVDTTTYEIHDIKGQVRYPVTLAEVLPYLLAFWGLAVLAILAWALLSSRRKKTVGESSYKDPPYIVALRKLERFRGDRYWAPDKQKTMYSGITDALREYIDSRYGIDAPEMTTAELFESLKDTDIQGDLLKDMRGLFETADLVKFAKSYATQEENAAAVPLAVRFVTSTYQAPSVGPATGGGNGTEPAGQEEGGTE